jgi:AcrR family transcriptional regulator
LHVPDTTTRTHLRFWRTSAKLSDAILELAVHQPSTEISVRALVLKAEVNRTTFYHHATNPTALLCATLARTLDQTISAAALLSEPQVLEGLLEAVVRHINEHEPGYRTSLFDPAAASALFHIPASHLAVRAASADPGVAGGRAWAIAGASTEVIRHTLAASRRQLERDDVMAVLASSRDLLHR